MIGNTQSNLAIEVNRMERYDAPGYMGRNYYAHKISAVSGCGCMGRKEEFAALETKLTHNLDHELDRFSKEIKDAIAQEILKRYYFQRGAILQRLKDDPDLKKAIEILNNQSEYSKILSVMK